MSIVYGSPFKFGICDTTGFAELPPGFRFRMSDDSFVKVIGPNGMEWYYVGGETPHLEACKVATAFDVERTEGRLKLGEEYIDDEQQIPLCYQ